MSRMRAAVLVALLAATRFAFAADLPACEGKDCVQILVFGDPQPKSKVDVDYFTRDVVEPAKPAAKRSVVGVALGDIVQDRPDLYPGIKAATKRLGIPWLFVPGNHDMDAGAKSDKDALDSFHKAFGKDSRTWSHDLASIIVLDDVIAQPGTSPGYIGGLREDQFAMLEQWLPTQPRERLMIVAVHIPFFDTSTVPGQETFRAADRARLFALLRPFPNVLLLSAHTHNQRHYFHGAKTGWQGERPLHEYNVGAACGAWIRSPTSLTNADVYGFASSNRYVVVARVSPRHGSNARTSTVCSPAASFVGSAPRHRCVEGVASGERS